MVWFWPNAKPATTAILIHANIGIRPLMHRFHRAILGLTLTIAAVGVSRADPADSAAAFVRLNAISTDAIAYDGTAAGNLVDPRQTPSEASPTPIPEPAGVGVLVAALAAACAALRIRAKRGRSSCKNNSKPPEKTP